jgi:hypothetical protein
MPFSTSSSSPKSGQSNEFEQESIILGIAGNLEQTGAVTVL